MTRAMPFPRFGFVVLFVLCGLALYSQPYSVEFPPPTQPFSCVNSPGDNINYVVNTYASNSSSTVTITNDIVWVKGDFSAPTAIYTILTPPSKNANFNSQQAVTQNTFVSLFLVDQAILTALTLAGSFTDGGSDEPTTAIVSNKLYIASNSISLAPLVPAPLPNERLIGMLSSIADVSIVDASLTTNLTDICVPTSGGASVTVYTPFVSNLSTAEVSAYTYTWNKDPSSTVTITPGTPASSATYSGASAGEAISVEVSAPGCAYSTATPPKLFSNKDASTPTPTTDAGKSVRIWDDYTPTISIATSSQELCEGSNSMTINLNPSSVESTAGAYGIQWYNSLGNIAGATSAMYVASNVKSGDEFYVEVTPSVASCAAKQSGKAKVFASSNIFFNTNVLLLNNARIWVQSDLEKFFLTSDLPPENCQFTSSGTTVKFSANTSLLGASGSLLEYSYTLFGGSKVSFSTFGSSVTTTITGTDGDISSPAIKMQIRTPGGCLSSEKGFHILSNSASVFSASGSHSGGPSGDTLVRVWDDYTPTISIANLDQELCEGVNSMTINLASSSGGGSPLSTYDIQWRNQLGPLSGENSAALTATDVQANDEFYALVGPSVKSCPSKQSSRVKVSASSDGFFSTNGPSSSNARIWVQSDLEKSFLTSSTLSPENCDFPVGGLSVTFLANTSLLGASKDVLLEYAYRVSRSPKSAFASTNSSFFAPITAVDADINSPAVTIQLRTPGGCLSSEKGFHILSNSSPVFSASGSHSGGPSGDTLARVWSGAPTISIATSSQELCEGSNSMTINLDPSSVGNVAGTYGIQWYNSLGKITGATSAMYVASNVNSGDEFYVEITPSVASCAAKLSSRVKVSASSDGFFNANAPSSSNARIWVQSDLEKLFLTSSTLPSENCDLPMGGLSVTFLANTSSLGASKGALLEYAYTVSGSPKSTFASTNSSFFAPITAVDADINSPAVTIQLRTPGGCVSSEKGFHILSNVASPFATSNSHSGGPAGDTLVRVWNNYKTTLQATSMELCPSEDLPLSLDFSGQGGSATSNHVNIEWERVRSGASTSLLSLAGSASILYSATNITANEEYIANITPSFGGCPGVASNPVRVYSNSHASLSGGTSATLVRLWDNTVPLFTNVTPEVCTGGRLEVSYDYSSLGGQFGSLATMYWSRDGAVTKQTTPVNGSLVISNVSLADLFYFTFDITKPGSSDRCPESSPHIVTPRSRLDGYFTNGGNPNNENVRLWNSAQFANVSTSTDIADPFALCLGLTDEDITLTVDISSLGPASPSVLTYQWYSKDASGTETALSATDANYTIVAGTDVASGLLNRDFYVKLRIRSGLDACEEQSPPVRFLSNSNSVFSGTSPSSPSASLVRVWDKPTGFTHTVSQMEICYTNPSLQATIDFSGVLGANTAFATASSWVHKRTVPSQVNVASQVIDVNNPSYTMTTVQAGDLLVFSNLYNLSSPSPTCTAKQDTLFVVKSATHADFNSGTIPSNTLVRIWDASFRPNLTIGRNSDGNNNLCLGDVVRLSAATTPYSNTTFEYQFAHNNVVRPKGTSPNNTLSNPAHLDSIWVDVFPVFYGALGLDAGCKFRSDTGRVYSASDNIFTTNSPTRTLVRLWDMNSFSISTDYDQTCLGEAGISFTLNLPPSTNLSDYTSVLWKKDGVSLAPSGQVYAPSSYGSGNTLDTKYTVDFTTSTALGTCAGEVRGPRVVTSEHSIFQTDRPSDALIRVFTSDYNTPSATLAAAEICEGAAVNASARIPKSTLDADGDYAVKWLRNSVAFQNGDASLSSVFFPTTSNLTSGDVIVVSIEPTGIPLSLSGSMSCNFTDTIKLLPLSSVFFETSVPTTKNVRVWNSATFKPTLSSSIVAICHAAGVVVPPSLSNAPTAYTLSVDYGFAKGLNASDFNHQWQDGSTATTYTVTNPLAGSSAYVDLTYNGLLTCPSTQTLSRSDISEVLLSSDPYFAVGSPDVNHVRLWADGIPLSLSSGTLEICGSATTPPTIEVTADVKKYANGILSPSFLDVALQPVGRSTSTALLPGSTSLSVNGPMSVYLTAKVGLDGFPSGAGGCFVSTNRIRVALQTDATFVTRGNNPNVDSLVRLWDNYAPTLNILNNELCELPLANIDINIDYSAIGGAGSFASHTANLKQEGGTAQTAISNGNTLPLSIQLTQSQVSSIDRSSVFSYAITPVSGSCPPSSTDVRILDNSDTYFLNNSPSGNIVRYWSQNMAIETVGSASGSYSFCEGDPITLRFSSTGGFSNFEWVRKRNNVETTLKSGSDVSITLSDLKAFDIIVARPLGTSICPTSSTESNQIEFAIYASSGVFTDVTPSIAPASSGGPVTSISGSPTVLCEGGASLGLSVDISLIGGYDQYFWKYERNGVIGDVASQGNSATTTTTIPLMPGDKIWAILSRFALGCSHYTDTIYVRSSSDAYFKSNSPSTSNILVYPSAGLSSLSPGKYSICGGEDLTLSIAAANFGYVANFEWILSELTGTSRTETIVAQGPGLSTHVQPSLGVGDQIWLRLTNGDGCVSNTDTVKILDPTSPATFGRVIVYESVSGELDASAATLCDKGDASFTLTNLVGVPTIAVWRKISQAGVSNVLANRTISATSDQYTGKGFVHADTIVVDLENAIGCIGKSNFVVIDDRVGLVNTTKLVRLFPPLTASLNADKRAYCSEEIMRVDLTNALGVPNEFKWIQSGTTLSIQSSANVPQSVRPDVTDQIWVELKNAFNCIGYSDTIKFLGDITQYASRTTKQPYLEKLERANIEERNGKNDFCIGETITADLQSFAGAGIETTSVVWYFKNPSGLPKMYSTGNLSVQFILGQDVVDGTELYAEFNDVSSRCFGKSKTITFTATNTPNATTWRYVDLPAIDARAVVDRFCASGFLTFFIQNASPSLGLSAYLWKKREAGTISDVTVGTSSTVTLSSLQHRDGVWCELTNTGGCQINSDTVIISNVVNAETPSQQYPLIYESVSGNLGISGSGNVYCLDDPITFVVSSTVGDVSEFQFKRKRGNFTIDLTGMQASSNYTSSPGTILPGDSVWVELTNPTGCKGLSTKIAVVSNTSTQALSASDLLIYDVVRGDASSDIDNVCPSGGVTLSSTIFANAGTVNTYEWRRLRRGIETSLATTASFSYSDIQEGDEVWCNFINTTGCSGATDTVRFSSSYAISRSNDQVWIRSYDYVASADVSNICVGATPITFSISYTGTVASVISYEWLRTSGGVTSTASTFAQYTTTGLVHGDEVRVRITDDANCVSTSNRISISNITTVPDVQSAIKIYDLDNVTISSNQDAVCVGDNVLFRIDPTIDPRKGAAYQWYREDANGITSQLIGMTGEAANFGVAAGQKVWCELKQPNRASACRTILSDEIDIISNSITPNPTRKHVILYDDVQINIASRRGGLKADSFCIGEEVQFSPFTASTSLSFTNYQWHRNGIMILGATGPTYTLPDLIQGDAVSVNAQFSSRPFCSFQSNKRVVKNLTTVSTPIVSEEIRVFDFWKATATPSVTEFCAGEFVSFLLTNASGSSPITQYRWVVNGVPQAPAPDAFSNSFASNQLKQGDQVWCELYNDLKCMVNSDTIYVSNTLSVDPQYIRIYDLKTTSLSYKKAICVGDQVSFSMPFLAGRNITSYDWKKNGVSQSSISIYNLTDLAAGDEVVCEFSEGGCPKVSSDIARVLSSTNARPTASDIVIYDQISAKVNYDEQRKCSNEQFIFSFSNLAVGVTSYIWYRAGGSLASPVAVVADQNVLVSSYTADEFLYAELTHGTLGCIGYSDTITLKRNDEQIKINEVSMFDIPQYEMKVSGLEAPAINEFCEGTPLTFMLNRLSGNAIDAYQWSKNGNLVGTNADQYLETGLAVGDILSCEVTNAACQEEVSGFVVISSKVTNLNSTIRMRTINKDVVRSSSSIICGTRPITFTVENPGVGPFTYLWTKNGSMVSTASTYEDNQLRVNDEISLELTNDIGCKKNTNSIRIIVKREPQKDEVRIAETNDFQAIISVSAPVLCLNGHNATFKVTNIPSSYIQSYTWMKNGVIVSTSATYADRILQYGDKISVRLVLSSGCDVVSQTLTAVLGTPQQNEFELRPFELNADAYTNSKEFCVTSSVAFALRNIPNPDQYSYAWHIDDVIKQVSQSGTFITKELELGDYVWCEVINNIGCSSPSDSVLVVATTSVGSVGNDQLAKRFNCQVNTGVIPTTLFPGDIINAAFTAGIVDALRDKTKTYVVQLSDFNGNFANPTDLAIQESSLLTGGIQAKIPEDVRSGCKYRIRVVIEGLDILTYLTNEADIFIVSKSDLDNMLFSYDPNESNLVQGQAGKSVSPVYEDRGCTFSFGIVDNPLPAYISIDAIDGTISWTNQLPFADQVIRVQMITPFDDASAVARAFYANYRLRADLKNYNIMLSPNPVSTASGVMRLDFQLTRESDVSVKVISESGEFVGELYQQQDLGAGTYAEFLDLSGLAHGNYILILEVNGHKIARQFLLF